VAVVAVKDRLDQQMVMVELQQLHHILDHLNLTQVVDQADLAELDQLQLLEQMLVQVQSVQ
jgi:hypothetical protein